MTKAELYVDDTEKMRRLVVKTEQGDEFEVHTFDGSGYYSDIWLRTADEIEESRKIREKAEDEELRRWERVDRELEARPWWKKLRGAK